MSAKMLARSVTEVFSPWIINTIFFSVLGYATGSTSAGLVTALLTGAGVMAGIVAMVAAGVISDHHATRPEQRYAAFGWIFVCLTGVLAALVTLGASRQLWTAFAGAVVFIVAYTVITRYAVKVSVHVGLWLICCTYLAYCVSPVWLVGLLALPIIGWARVYLKEHTITEVLVGAVVSGIISAGALAVIAS